MMDQKSVAEHLVLRLVAGSQYVVEAGVKWMLGLLPLQGSIRIVRSVGYDECSLEESQRLSRWRACG